MATLQVGNATIGYAAEGQGIPLLLFHGTTMNRTAWDMVRAALPAETYQCVMVEFPGSGESSMPTGQLTVEELVDQALAMMTHLGHDTFHVGGFSLGAVVALATAATAPDRVLSATSVCGWAAADPRMRITFLLWKKLIATDPELFAHYTTADGFTVGALSVVEPMLDAILPVSATMIAPGSAAQLDLDIALDITSLLASIVAPTLIVGGIDDRWVDVSHSRTLATSIAGSRLVELPAGHMVIQELAVDVANALHAHLERR